MKATIMHQKEKGQAALIILGNRGAVQFKSTTVEIFNGKQVGKIKQANDYTLQPIHPYNSGKAITVILIVPDAV